MPFVDFKALKQSVSIERAAQLLNLKLHKSGQQLRGQCPACQTDDDRSLAITPGKGLYFCHAAQVGGDCISLVAHVLDLSMRDAAEWLQDTLPATAGTTVPQKPEGGANRPNPQRAAESPPTFDPAAYAAKLAYNDEVRALGIAEDDAKRLSIGYANRGYLQGRVCFPVRDEQGNICGFIGWNGTDIKVPKQWLTTANVVPLKRRA